MTISNLLLRRKTKNIVFSQCPQITQITYKSQNCQTPRTGGQTKKISWFLASPDAPEVMVVTESVIVSTDLTDVTLVSDESYQVMKVIR